MWIANATLQRNGVGSNDALAVVERCEVIAVVGNGVVEVLVVVGGEVDEEIVLIRFALVERDGEVASDAGLSLQDGCRKGDGALLPLGEFQNAPLISDPLGIGRLPKYDGTVFSYRGKCKVGVDVVGMTGDDEQCGIGSNGLLVGELRQHADGELALASERLILRVGGYETCGECGGSNRTAVGRACDVAIGGDDTIVARRPFNLQLTKGGGQLHIGLQLGEVARRECLHLCIEAQRVGIGVERLQRSDDAGDFRHGDIGVVDAEVAVEGTAQIGIALIAAAAQIVLFQLTDVAGMQGDTLRGTHTIEVEACTLSALHDQEIVPAPFLQSTTRRDALLAAVVGLCDGKACVLGVEEEIAFGRRVGETPDEITIGLDVGVFRDEDVDGDDIVATERMNEFAESLTEVEVAIVGAQ